MSQQLRQLGSTPFQVSPVALGVWPMAGVTTLDVNDADSIATIRAAAEAGINHIDTAYVYGPHGESDLLVRQATEGRRDDFVIASKVGIHYENGQMVQDASAETIARECDELLERLRTDRVELLYLHSPDPKITIEESASALGKLKEAGKALSVGVSNCSLPQIQAFHGVTPIDAVQLPYNMLQRGIERKTLPWCIERGISVMVYWALMKGLLAGKLPRDHMFDESDSRRKYPMYQGEEWKLNQDFVDKLRLVSNRLGCTVAQLVVAWTFAQPGITAALCGAKRPNQIADTAAALQLQLDESAIVQIDEAIAERGTAETNRVFE